MPPWLLILILMEGVILLINPTRKDFAWYRGLRRPQWVPFASSIPVIWLLIHFGFYLSSLVSWQVSNNWNLVMAYILLLVLVESYTWIMCRTRRLGTGSLLCLLGWAYGLVLAAALLSLSLLASALLIPYLLWAPVEALITWDMRRLNRLS
ncbi:MAG: tryptophan-rich sensory protein [Synechococcaceae cyanobacterium]|nr:tryptophan-rich sensory protein [Synechococcaceae cyanobacterium]